MFYISATLVDKLLPVAARGDIEGALLALIINLVIYFIFGYGLGRLIRYSIKTFQKHFKHKNIYTNFQGENFE